jgi:outer membrane protein assembly factor BamB
MSKNTVARILIISGIVAAVPDLAHSQNWTQWRGPNRDGVVASFVAPRTWPETLKPQWKTPIGIGHSTPVVSEGKVYAFTRQDDNEVATCLDLETGKQIWQRSYPAPYTMNPAAISHGKGPKSTPVVSDGKLFTLGISGILSCFDAKTGRVIWRKEFSKQFKESSPLFGTAMSPLVDRGLVIAHVGGNDAGALTAFNVDTGDVKWSWKDDGPGYASPIMIEVYGVRQIVTQTQKNIVGVAALTGELLWRIPFETEYVQNAITPVAYGSTLIFSGLDKGAFAIQLARVDGKWVTSQLWKNDQVPMYLSSPVIVGDLLFGLSHKRKGQFFCLDARTGKPLWASLGRDGDQAAILAAGGFLFFLTSDAELIVARASSNGYDVLMKYTVATSPTWAHPVIIGNRVLIKDERTLALLRIE